MNDAQREPGSPDPSVAGPDGPAPESQTTGSGAPGSASAADAPGSAEPAGAARGTADSKPESTEPAAGSRELEQLKNILLFLPRLALLLGKLVADPAVEATDKLLLGAAILYIASPLDILPDFIPVVGQLDDIYLVALCLLRLLNRSGEAKLRQHWDGPENIVGILHKVTDLATRYLPQPVRNAVRSWVEARSGQAPPGGAA